jgi:hypothetical protein
VHRNQPRQPVPDTDFAHDMHVGVHRRLAGGGRAHQVDVDQTIYVKLFFFEKGIY